MNYRITPVFLVIILLSLMSHAQKAPDTRDSEKNQLREIATSALSTSLEETTKIEDYATRIDLTEKIVKLLADDRFEDCRKSVDKLFNSLIDEKRTNKENKKISFDDAISKVIRIASILSKQLAQKYIDRYNLLIDEENRADKEEGNYSKAKVYLAVATKLIESDPAFAASTAEKSLPFGILIETLDFLAALKKKQAPLADNFLLKALQSLERKKAKDINELFILYSYVFVKPQVPFVTENTLAYIPTRNFAIAADHIINSNLAGRFLLSSINLLNDQSRLVADGATAPTHGPLGDYFFLKLTEQFIQQYAPQMKAQAYQQQLAIYNYLEQERRSDISDAIDTWGSKKRDSGSAKENWLEKAEKALTPELRDSYLYEAAMAAIAAKELDEALKIADAFSEKSTETFQPFIRYTVARKLVEEKAYDKIEVIIKKDPDKCRMVSLYLFMAKQSLKDKEFGSAREFISLAEKLKDKLENSEKAIAEFAIASLYAGFEETLAVGMWQDGIKSSNSVEGFSNRLGVSRSFKKGSFANYYQLFDEQMKSSSFLQKLSANRFLPLLNELSNINSKVFKIESNIALCTPHMKNKLQIARSK